MRRLVYVSFALVFSFGLAAAQAGVITDNFDTAHDYSAGNVTGTVWSGVMNAGNASNLNATTTNAGRLTIGTDTGNGMDAADHSAPFLYMNVGSGDFTVQVEVPTIYCANYSYGSLLVWQAGETNNFVSIAPNNFVASGSKRLGNWVNNVDDIKTTYPGVLNGETTWVRMTRVGSVFTAYKSTDGDTWVQASATTFDRPDLAGDVQVGLAYGTALPVTDAYITYDNFSITTAEVPEPSTLALLGAGLMGLLAYAWRKRR